MNVLNLIKNEKIHYKYMNKLSIEIIYDILKNQKIINDPENCIALNRLLSYCLRYKEFNIYSFPDF